MLFPGRLPDFNLGTVAGQSCNAEVQARLQKRLQQMTTYTHAVNGRFQGGYITRHYGDPDRGVQAIQLELAQLNYMDEYSFAWDEAKAVSVRQHIDLPGSGRVRDPLFEGEIMMRQLAIASLLVAGVALSAGVMAQSATPQAEPAAQAAPASTSATQTAAAPMAHAKTVAKTTHHKAHHKSHHKMHKTATPAADSTPPATPAG